MPFVKLMRAGIRVQSLSASAYCEYEKKRNETKQGRALLIVRRDYQTPGAISVRLLTMRLREKKAGRRIYARWRQLSVGIICALLANIK